MTIDIDGRLSERGVMGFMSSSAFCCGSFLKSFCIICQNTSANQLGGASLSYTVAFLL